jgi:hypothetical protein
MTLTQSKCYDESVESISTAEQNFLKLVFMPLASTLTSWSRSRTLFISEGETILNLVDGLSPRDLNERVQIPRMIGMDKSSCHWSIAMALEHLMITGREIADIIVDLSWGRVPEKRVDLNLVQPTGRTMQDARKVFRPFMGMVCLKLDSQVEDWASDATLSHPWFGELNARQWHTLLSWHQKLHRRQVQSILRYGLFGL